MPPTRDPHPYPKLENEESFTGQPRSSQVPKDDLDFRIKTLYDHHSGFLQDKSQVLLHSETVNDDHGRLKMPIPEELPPPVLPYKTIQGTLRHWVNPKKESIYSVQGTIGEATGVREHHFYTGETAWLSGKSTGLGVRGCGF
uniref:Uncharacterized protein n=1 Tax=Ornithorhynchus anatinus TaxID=9258 RepID=A0A6I8P869_ORNAN